MNTVPTGATILHGVREYSRSGAVWIVQEPNGRLALCATVPNSMDATAIDLGDVIEWIRKNQPELMEESVRR